MNTGTTSRFSFISTLYRSSLFHLHPLKYRSRRLQITFRQLSYSKSNFELQKNHTHVRVVTVPVSTRPSSSKKGIMFEMPPPTHEGQNSDNNNSNSKSRVLILGSGNFGSCLADHLADSNHEVILWSRSLDFVEHFNTHHKNPKYLTEHVFPDCITAVGPDLPSAEMLGTVDVILFAIPTEALRSATTYTSLLSGLVI